MPDDPQNEIIQEIAPGGEEAGLGAEPEVAQNPFVEAVTNDGIEQTAALSANIDGAAGPDTQINTAFAIDDRELEERETPSESVAANAAITEDEQVLAAAVIAEEEIDVTALPEAQESAPAVEQPQIPDPPREYTNVFRSLEEGNAMLLEQEIKEYNAQIEEIKTEQNAVSLDIQSVDAGDVFSPNQVPANNIPQRQGGMSLIPN